MLLESTADAAVPWTAPRDFDINLEAMSKDGMFAMGITQAAFGDGSVRVISESVAMDVLKAMLTRSGGEVIPR